MKHACAAALLLLATLAGCLRPSPGPPALYHTLRPLPEPPAADNPSGKPCPDAVAVLPARLPDLLCRPQMALPEGRALVLSDRQRWAEPLDQAAARVLAADLSRRLGGAAVLSGPDGARIGAAFRVALDVDRWDARDGPLTLDATWLILDGGSGRCLARRAGSFQAPVSADDGDALAEAHSRTLAELADQVAEALRRLGDCQGK
jgi:hypothetical protein